jgi:hypothetical protein
MRGGCGFCQCELCVSVPVHHDFLIAPINPKSIAQRADVTSSAQCALRYMCRLCAYAIDFTLRTVRRYTANESLSFPIASSHLSQLFINACG